MGFQASFKALSDPTRREILRMLRDGALPVGEITARFTMSGATISHHLAVLREAGLVLDEKQGRYIYYELNTSVVDELLGWLSSLKGGDDFENAETASFVGGGDAPAASGGGAVDAASGAGSGPLGCKR